MSAGILDIEQELRRKLVATAREARSITHNLMVSLAQELAMDINPIDHILKHHSMDRDELEQIVTNPTFQQLYREALVAWGATSSAQVRIKAKMESMVEQALPDLYNELCAPGLPAAKVELVKAMMKGGGIGEKASDGAAAGGFQIIINMDSGPEAKPVTIEGVAISHDAEDL